MSGICSAVCRSSSVAILRFAGCFAIGSIAVGAWLPKPAVSQGIVQSFSDRGSPQVFSPGTPRGFDQGFQQGVDPTYQRTFDTGYQQGFDPATQRAYDQGYQSFNTTDPRAFDQGIPQSNWQGEPSLGDNFFNGGGGQGRNFYGWVSHVEGNQIGNTEPFTSFGGTGYRLDDRGSVLFPGQVLVTNNGDVSLSLGAHRRVIRENGIVGAGVFVDASQSQNENWFQQVSFAMEGFRGPWTARGNFSLPFGNRTEVIESFNQFSSTQPYFVGHNIATGQTSFQLDETAMQRLDVEIARSLGNLSRELFVGYYSLNGEIGPSSDGIKGGVRGYVAPRLAGNVAISDDRLFGTNVYGGFTFFFGSNGGNAPNSIQDKLTIPVERNAQVAVNEVVTNQFVDNLVFLTDQGQPITFNHINSGGVGGDGTIENPFRNLTDADTDPNKDNRDIVYVHSGSVFNGQSYAASPNQRVLGEGDDAVHLIQTDQLGLIQLPNVNGAQFPRPVLNGGTIIANNGTEIANFRFNNAAGAIRMSNLAGNVNVNRTLITGGTSGIDILGGTGQFTFSDVGVSGQSDVGIDIVGGSGTFTFDGLSSIDESTGGTAVRVRGGHDGQVSFDPGSRISATDGDGLQFDDADGDYDFRGQVSLNGGDAGIDILGDSAGTFTFTDTTITDPTGEGINIDGGSSEFTFSGLSSIQQNNTGSAVRVGGGHTGQVVFDSGTNITSTNGDGLQFDDANGTYDFTGQTTLSGGDAGIDILGGSAGTFTFSDTSITDPTGTGLNVDGGTSDVTFGGTSLINKGNSGSTVRVAGGHNGRVVFDPSTRIGSTDGDGLQFDDADGSYDFRGQVQLNGGDAGIDILGDSGGTFTFTDTAITDPTGTGLNIDGGSSDIRFGSLSSINKGTTGSTVRVAGGHTGQVTFDSGSTVAATNGDGLQFDNADGTYDFQGVTTLNGGDAGIDILGGSAGTFTFGDSTTITNPTGAALSVVNLESTGTINYNGSIQSNNDVIYSIDTTAAGSQVNFIDNGSNSLTSTDNPLGAIFIFDADGDITQTTSMVVTRPEFSSLFATDGDGTWTFNDLTIVDQKELNAGIDVFGNMGTVNFTNLNITTDSAGTGDAATGFLAGGNNIVNVFGNSNVNADGGGAVVLININEIDITFNNVTSTNNLNSQIGFAGDDGIDLLNIGAGTFDVTGTTTVRNADGVGISVEDTGATVTFNDVVLDTIGQDGIISGVAFDNPGIVNINGGTVNDIGGDGFRIGNSFGEGVLGGFNLNNTTFTNISGVVGSVGNSQLGGVGNIATVFSCTDFGGNTGNILFNGGADSCPN